MAQATAAANRILSLRETTKPTDLPPPAALNESEGGVKIEFKDVHFKYPTRDVPVFKGLSLSVSGKVL